MLKEKDAEIERLRQEKTDDTFRHNARHLLKNEQQSLKSHGSKSWGYTYI
jgi:hypothetical protein